MYIDTHLFKFFKSKYSFAIFSAQAILGLVEASVANKNCNNQNHLLTIDNTTGNKIY